MELQFNCRMIICSRTKEFSVCKFVVPLIGTADCSVPQSRTSDGYIGIWSAQEGQEGGEYLLVGPPMFTITNGFGKGASSACQSAAAKRSAEESARCSAPAVRIWLCKFHMLKTAQQLHDENIQCILYKKVEQHTTFGPGGSCGVIHLRRRHGTSFCPFAVKA